MDAAKLRADPSAVAALIDHTNVEPDATRGDIQTLCEEVREYGFCSAVVVPYHAAYAADLVGDVANVVAVIGFPYGVQNEDAKTAEIEAILSHVDELDMVMNRTAFANRDHETVVSEIQRLKEVVGEKTLKCIIESPALTDAEIRTAAELVEEGGADFVKTAVGYEGGCDADEVRAMRESVSADVSVKASGGIHSFEEALEMVEAGASRLGASAGVEIVESVSG